MPSGFQAFRALTFSNNPIDFQTWMEKTTTTTKILTIATIDNDNVKNNNNNNDDNDNDNDVLERRPGGRRDDKR